MKSLKYFWPGIGRLKIAFPKRHQGFRAVVRFDPDIEALLRKEQSTQDSRGSSPDIPQHPENR